MPEQHERCRQHFFNHRGEKRTSLLYAKALSAAKQSYSYIHEHVTSAGAHISVPLKARHVGAERGDDDTR